MARPNSNSKTIQFTFLGKRRTLRVAKLSNLAVEKLRRLIKLALASEKENDGLIENEIRKYVEELPQEPLERLEVMGLIDLGNKSIPSQLGALVEHYRNSRTDVEPSTQDLYRQGGDLLVAHFGANKKIAAITVGDAEQFKIDLLNTKARHRETTMKPSTVSKRIDFASQLFRYAVTNGALSENVFEGIKVAGDNVVAEHAEITPKMFAAIIPNCNVDWRLILTLCRYGGMRCPSEVLSLQWQNIYWDNYTMRVTSPKTRRYGKGSRIVPLYPEVRAELERAWDAAPEGAVYVVDEKYRKACLKSGRWKNVNLRTQFEKIIWKSGLQPWPNLFHSMRSTRATELLDEGHSPHAVAEWQGDKVSVLLKHYAKVRGSHIAKAAQVGVEEVAKAVKAPSKNHPEGRALQDNPCSAAKSAAAPSGKGPHTTP